MNYRVYFEVNINSYRYLTPDLINVKFNLREWRHFFKMRCSLAAHPQMRELSLPLLAELKSKIPILFDDLTF